MYVLIFDERPKKLSRRQQTQKVFTLSNLARSKVPAGPVTTAQDPLESLPEFRAENRINHRIQSRIKVTQPQRETHDVVAYYTRVPTQRHQQGQDEERQPAHHEGPSNDRQRLRRLSFPLRL